MEKRSFEIVVEGQYTAVGEASGTPTVKFYKARFTLPSQEAALSVVCKHLLAPYLRKNYQDFIRYRTHRLVSITAIGRKPNTDVLQMSLEDMDVGQLSDFCILKGIMIDPYKHSDLVRTRERVAESWRVLRQNKKDNETSAAGADQRERDALLDANELPKEDETVKVNLRERQATAAVQASKPASTGADVSRETIEDDGPLPPVEVDKVPEEMLE